ncbi:Rieske (2Fe-2S) protein [Pararhodobacter sp. CCB-MM2]|uniref:Rieske (2Fe-2S) protein n=1 Tax=Pararhodobacter sp. CCB-MM2 TaxID=1786003 RepID=UPI0008314EA3|nr:Rieske (2Fe-2S) protein [Pararhodobacter sp. CCB-MM2]
MSINGWFPLSLAASVTPGSSTGAVLQGQDIVLWRDASGAPHAWEDRCPHRGMKLSFGFVRGDHIACLYHGWEYGADGQCRSIPAHPKLEVPKTICATTYGIAESGGLLWAGLGEHGEAPDLPAADPVRSVQIEAPINAVLAALPTAFGATGLSLDGPLAMLDTEWGRLAIGLHELGPQRTALHLTRRLDPEDEDSTPARIALARAATRLRDQVEAATHHAAAVPGTPQQGETA